MKTVLYAYQISPGHDAPLFFTRTLEECKAAAVEQRAELKSHAEICDLGPMAVYECAVAIDVPTLLEMLNYPDERAGYAVVSKRVIAVVGG